MPKYYSPDGNIEVWKEKPQGYYTVEEWQELHPASAPPEPTIDEQLAELDSNYNTQKASISEQYTSAMMVDDTELASELKAELLSLNEWYDEEYEKITGGAYV